jgi:hypothetical protein
VTLSSPVCCSLIATPQPVLRCSYVHLYRAAAAAADIDSVLPRVYVSNCVLSCASERALLLRQCTKVLVEFQSVLLYELKTFMLI